MTCEDLVQADTCEAASSEKVTVPEEQENGLKSADRLTRLQWFARQVIDEAWSEISSEIENDLILDFAKQAGLVVCKTATEDEIGTLSIEDIEPGDLYYAFGPDIDGESIDWSQLGYATPGAEVTFSDDAESHAGSLNQTFPSEPNS